MKVVALFGNKGGTGKTTIAENLFCSAICKNKNVRLYRYDNHIEPFMVTNNHSNELDDIAIVDWATDYSFTDCQYDEFKLLVKHVDLLVIPYQNTILGTKMMIETFHYLLQEVSICVNILVVCNCKDAVPDDIQQHFKRYYPNVLLSCLPYEESLEDADYDLFGNGKLNLSDDECQTILDEYSISNACKAFEPLSTEIFCLLDNLKGTCSVYCHENQANGKRYVGMTHHVDVNGRWNCGSGYFCQSEFYSAIKKYGWENFNHFILMKDLTMNDAHDYESYFIKKYDSVNCGYNKDYGLMTCTILDNMLKRIKHSGRGRLEPLFL